MLPWVTLPPHLNIYSYTEEVLSLSPPVLSLVSLPLRISCVTPREPEIMKKYRKWDQGFPASEERLGSDRILIFQIHAAILNTSLYGIGKIPPEKGH
jgi:hypothetical protein